MDPVLAEILKWLALGVLIALVVSVAVQDPDQWP